MAGDTKEILKSLAVNVTIASAKGLAAFFTGSGTMLAEAIHSSADCVNQVLLLIGVSLAKKPPDEKFPLGYGRSVYFWSFIVALLLFSGGGVFSIYEGIHKLGKPEPVEHVNWGFGILGFSLLLEGWATFGNLVEMKKRRGSVGLYTYLRDTKDSDLVVLFGENAAAVMGLVFALAALGMTVATGDSRWDSVGSLLIGVVLIGVAIFLGREVMSLLLGERADPRIEIVVKEVALTQPNIKRLIRVLTVQQGPGEVMVACKVHLIDELDTHGVVETIDAFEKAIHERVPDIRWLFVEPDDDD
ncbi:MAG: cation diffusion facilitator family transporter [Myxococcales bacterium]|nr:cation diffusion facilitator family transporter [Myxococcales bacterium]